MHGELTIPAQTLVAFTLVAARVGAALVFVPLPGVRRGAAQARIVLVLALTVLLFPQWPVVAAVPSPARMAGWLLADAAFGLLAGLLVGFIAGALQIAAQAVGLEAGFAYASMVDPQTQADSGVLLVFAQLAAGLIFVALGLDREVIRIFARSLEAFPPGTLAPAAPAMEEVARLGAGMFSTGARLALPVLALLALVDIALALIGRLNAQLQLLTLAFPLKMLAAVLMLAWIAPVFPRVLGGYSRQVLAGLAAVTGLR
ncbi:MAG: flagellar biosynthetic protein FliR [Bryobacterales bacterium]|nr:flagellar biosynthetic protein FliR [Bryobacterales bacterium]